MCFVGNMDEQKSQKNASNWWHQMKARETFLSVQSDVSERTDTVFHWWKIWKFTDWCFCIMHVAGDFVLMFPFPMCFQKWKSGFDFFPDLQQTNVLFKSWFWFGTKLGKQNQNKSKPIFVFEKSLVAWHLRQDQSSKSKRQEGQDGAAGWNFAGAGAVFLFFPNA